MRSLRGQLFVGLLAGLVAACQLVGQAPTPEPVEPAADPALALEALCDANSAAGLRSLAGTLEAMDDDTDLAPITALVRTALSNLLAVQVPAANEPPRAAAVAALREMLNAIADPRLRNAMVRSQAAAALRTAEPALCADEGGPPTPGAPGGTTQQRLCSPAGPTSLGQMIARLDALAADPAGVDVSGLTEAIDATTSDLYALTGNLEAKHVADSAAAMLTQLRSVLDDPQARGTAAAMAASSVRSAQAAVCR